MKKDIILEEQDLGNGLYVYKVNKESSELPGKTVGEKLKFAIKDFLKFPERKHHHPVTVTHHKKSK